ncbi:tetratricopeptide repeat-containing sulfotransferase family protein [Hyphococcus sp.]|uniref:tetratricopeptide repeat-containing sulfotransferase family protein n=1 Tax=Hyphococcus sp. TaxID=2038636 RepID=UPI003CCBA2B2
MAEAIHSTQHLLQEADRRLRERNPVESARICKEIIHSEPQNIDARLIFARSCQMLGAFDEMLEHAEAALNSQPEHRLAALMRIEALIATGRIADAKDVVNASLKNGAKDDPVYLARLAEMQTQLGDHMAALSSLTTAASMRPADPALSYNLASAELACGDMNAAEKRLDRLVAQTRDADAAYNRATLRTQTANRNHVSELREKLRLKTEPRSEFAYCYALAKELEDLGEYDESFAFLSRGAAARRKLLQYRVEADLNALALIENTFNEEFFRQRADGCGEEGSVFIVGLPRSGTTLVERILSSHPDVESVGEVNDFAMALTRHCGGASGKSSLIERSANADFAAIGRQYRQSTSERSGGARYIIDKTPLNFLYAGLIAKALPKAKIIHVERDNMDVGFAMYKTLFRMGYPFSYDLTDIGRYMRAKAALMKHWREMLDGRIVSISYESLIAAQETESRRLVDALELDWNDRCLSFHENQTPTATASAAQVRRPIYASSIGKWRKYEKHLGELLRAFET